MTRWTRFRLWLWRKVCPRMTIIVRCGKTVDGRFATTKQFLFKRPPSTTIILNCEFKFDKDYEVKFGDKTFSKEEILVMIDDVTSAETVEETMQRMDEENGSG